MQARELDQNPRLIQELVQALHDGATLDEIVLVGDTILDGHHRAAAYAVAGMTPRTVTLSLAEYAMLQAAGYDDMEIAAAAHLARGEFDAARNLDAEFPGAGVLDRAELAAELL